LLYPLLCPHRSPVEAAGAEVWVVVVGVEEEDHICLLCPHRRLVEVVSAEVWVVEEEEEEEEGEEGGTEEEEERDHPHLHHHPRLQVEEVLEVGEETVVQQEKVEVLEAQEEEAEEVDLTVEAGEEREVVAVQAFGTCLRRWQQSALSVSPISLAGCMSESAI
jgi:hypothetical protein